MKYAFFILVWACHLPVAAQVSQWESLNDREKSVMQVVLDVFDGMRQGDSAMVKACFFPQASAYTAFTESSGSPQLRMNNIDDWYKAIGEPREQVWDERIWDYEVRIDQNLATVWVRYAFYLGQSFHHCGVDAIQLAYDGKDWRIFHLADTRQVTGCEIPPNIAAGDTF